MDVGFRRIWSDMLDLAGVGQIWLDLAGSGWMWLDLAGHGRAWWALEAMRLVPCPVPVSGAAWCIALHRGGTARHRAVSGAAWRSVRPMEQCPVREEREVRGPEAIKG